MAALSSLTAAAKLICEHVENTCVPIHRMTPGMSVQREHLCVQLKMVSKAKIKKNTLVVCLLKENTLQRGLSAACTEHVIATETSLETCYCISAPTLDADALPTVWR